MAMRSNLELNDYEFIAMNNLKRAALALSEVVHCNKLIVV